MRSREEVLREFGTGVNCDYASFVQAAHDMADRIRELEAKGVAEIRFGNPLRGEAVAWAVYDSDGAFVDVRKNAESAERARGCGDTVVPLYAAPVAAGVK